MWLRDWRFGIFFGKRFSAYQTSEAGCPRIKAVLSFADNGPRRANEMLHARDYQIFACRTWTLVFSFCGKYALNPWNSKSGWRIRLADLCMT
jgi:hypothetical protein